MRRLLGVVLLALLLVEQAGLVVGASGSCLTVLGHVVMYVPAVTFAPNGSLVGVPSTLEVRAVYPGSGRVYFATSPLTQIDTQAAARIAALIASLYARVDPLSIDWMVRLEAESPMVGGPSASAATALAMYAVLTGRRVPRNVSLTGMIDADGSIGPVGGVAAKLRAMAEVGVKVFYIPRGEELVPKITRVVVRRGNIIIERETTVMVNVTELGEKLGVRVVPVASFAQLIHDVFGVRIPRVKPTLPPVLRGYLERVARVYAAEASGNLTEARRLFQSMASGLGTQVANLVGSLLREAERLIRESKHYLDRGLYYTAASDAFAAAIDATTALEVLRVLQEGGPTPLYRLLNETASILKSVNETLSRLIERRDLNALQVAIGVYERLTAAHDAYTAAIVSLHDGDAVDAARYAVYAYYRARSAADWASTYTLVGPGPVYQQGRLRETVSAFTGFAEMLVTYMQRLGIMNDYLALAEQALRRLQTLVSMGAPYEDRLAVAIDAIVYSTLALHREYNTARLLYNASRETALYAYSVVKGLGVTPILPASYIEAGDAAKQPLDKIRFYMRAAAILLVLYTMAASRLKPRLPGLCGLAKPGERVKTVTAVEERTVTHTVTVTRRSVETATLTVYRGAPLLASTAVWAGVALIAVGVLAAALAARSSRG